MKNNIHLFAPYTSEEINKKTNKYNRTPFMLFTNYGKPFNALGETLEGFYFSTPYFILKNNLLDRSCLELMLLEPVGMDGCLVEYPESFYSLQTTSSCIIISTKCLSGIQTFSSKFVNREIINPAPKECEILSEGYKCREKL